MTAQNIIEEQQEQEILLAVDETLNMQKIAELTKMLDNASAPMNSQAIVEYFNKEETFKRMLKYGITKELYGKTLTDIVLVVAKIPNDKSKPTLKDIVECFIASASTGLSLSPELKEAYLYPQGGRYVFMPSYIGLIKMAFRHGFTIDVECISFGNKDIGYEDLAEYRRKTINNSAMWGLQTLPQIDFLASNLNELLEKYEWKKTDILYIYATVLGPDGFSNTKVYSIAEIMERCMETNHYTKKKDYKNAILKNYLKDKDVSRRTDLFEILKVRAIRQALKIIPNEQMRLISSMIDRVDGYGEDAEYKETPVVKKNIINATGLKI